MPNRRAPLRLLFDENLPWRVAEALQALEFQVSYVGMEVNGEVPLPRGSPDGDVLDHARRTNQIVATSDLGMIILCAEGAQSVVWIDDRKRPLGRAEMVLLVFKQIHDWQDRVEKADRSLCLRAMRTKTSTLELDEAARLVRDRKRRISAARKPIKKPAPLGPLLNRDDSESGG